MATENHTEFSVNGLVIFDLNDLPPVTVEDGKITAGNTVIPVTGSSLSVNGADLSYDELRQRSQELYAIALWVRDAQTSPELVRMIAVIERQTNHTGEEARSIALAMLQSGTSLDG